MQGRKLGFRPRVQAKRHDWQLTQPLVAAVLFGLLLFYGALPALANPFTELPANHWSFGALAGLVASRLVAPQDVLDLQSGSSVMRFEVALAVAKAVRSLNQGVTPVAAVALDPLLAAYRVGAGSQARPLTLAERGLIGKLVAEFLPELEVLGLSFAGTTEVPPSTPSPELLPVADASGAFVDLDDLLTGPAQVAAVPAEAPLPPPAPVPVAAPAVPAVSVALPGAGAAEAGLSAEPASAPRSAPPTPPVVVDPSPAPAGGAHPAAPEPASELPAVVAVAASVVSAPSGVATLPGDALRRQGVGILPGRVAVDTQSTYETVPSAKPVLAVDAAVQTGETRLPVPGINVSVAPTVRLSSEVAPGGATHAQAGSVEVAATVQIAGVEMGASVKNVQALDSKTEDELAETLRVGAVPEQSGIGLSLRLGQLAFMTDFSKVRKEEGSIEHRRGFGVGYSLGSTAVLRAGYQLVDLDAIAGGKPRADASVGVNVNLTRAASVSAGMTLEGMRSGLPTGAEGQRTTAGVELRLPWNTFATAGVEVYHPSVEESSTVPSQSAATVGLGYNFAPNATLLVGYRLIDFGADAPERSRQQSLTAGVSLSF